ncbi:unnamed protein product [Vitrella brassicaformis CCMP3155]|uniref:Uncharacterized protein n=1 Tax=Vitrella brassicaformis (strain CCMP3155) TaxID=1169540 RepID=A0A0G4ELL8_VITBC|nr:unnamed protein product [Vitrella brassicaformis CCMP3155]|eukprot:CEL98318.1 unnamed protein product [Vitrella brassicaformis CCMP3155]
MEEAASKRKKRDHDAPGAAAAAAARQSVRLPGDGECFQRTTVGNGIASQKIDGPTHNRHTEKEAAKDGAENKVKKRMGNLQTVNIDATEGQLPLAVELLQASKATLKYIRIDEPTARRPWEGGAPGAQGGAAASGVVFDGVEELRVTNQLWLETFRRHGWVFPELSKLGVGHVYSSDRYGGAGFQWHHQNTHLTLPSLTHIVSTSPKLTSIQADVIDTVDGTEWRAFCDAVAGCANLTSIEGLTLLASDEIRLSAEQKKADSKHNSVLKRPVYHSLAALTTALNTHWSDEHGLDGDIKDRGSDGMPSPSAAEEPHTLKSESVEQVNAKGDTERTEARPRKLSFNHEFVFGASFCRQLKRRLGTDDFTLQDLLEWARGVKCQLEWRQRREDLEDPDDRPPHPLDISSTTAPARLRWRDVVIDCASKTPTGDATAPKDGLVADLIRVVAKTHEKVDLVSAGFPIDDSWAELLTFPRATHLSVRGGRGLQKMLEGIPGWLLDVDEGGNNRRLPSVQHLYVELLGELPRGANAGKLQALVGSLKHLRTVRIFGHGLGDMSQCVSYLCPAQPLDKLELFFYEDTGYDVDEAAHKVRPNLSYPLIAGIFSARINSDPGCIRGVPRDCVTSMLSMALTMRPSKVDFDLQVWPLPEWYPDEHCMYSLNDDSPSQEEGADEEGGEEGEGGWEKSRDEFSAKCTAMVQDAYDVQCFEHSVDFPSMGVRDDIHVYFQLGLTRKEGAGAGR